MSESGEQTARLPTSVPRRLPRVVLMATIFLSGAIVGGVWGRFVAREQMLSMLQHPEQVPDRILPQIRLGLSLDDDQTRQVEAIVRRRHAAMEVVRSNCYPELLEQF